MVPEHRGIARAILEWRIETASFAGRRGRARGVVGDPRRAGCSRRMTASPRLWSQSENRLRLFRNPSRLERRAGVRGFSDKLLVQLQDVSRCFFSDGCMRFASKTVIVTGGSYGIGEGCCRVFHAEGANVAVVSRGVSAGEALASVLNTPRPGSAGSTRAMCRICGSWRRRSDESRPILVGSTVSSTMRDLTRPPRSSRTRRWKTWKR